MNHKRGKARSARAGCKLCKPWKINGIRTERADGERFSDHRRRTAADSDIAELLMASREYVARGGRLYSLEEVIESLGGAP